jgi:hypothetical protein
MLLHVLYDSPVMQAAACQLCERTREGVDSGLELEVVWSHFQQLVDERYAREAAEVAALSDIVIVATRCRVVLPGSVNRWLGEWMCQTHKPDGAFCGLFARGADTHGPAQPPIAAVLEAAAELTGRKWLAGSVPEPAQPTAPKPPATRTSAGSFRWEHAPLCHGING